MEKNNQTSFNPSESWDEDPRVYGWVLGIEGEAMLGVGRTKREAYDDAMSNSGERFLEKRGGDVYFYPCSERSWIEANEEGDGYRGNAFSLFSRDQP